MRQRFVVDALPFDNSLLQRGYNRGNTFFTREMASSGGYVLTPAGLVASRDAPPYAAAGSDRMQQFLREGFDERSRHAVTIDEIRRQFVSNVHETLKLKCSERPQSRLAALPPSIMWRLEIAVQAEAFFHQARYCGFITEQSSVAVEPS